MKMVIDNMKKNKVTILVCAIVTIISIVISAFFAIKATNIPEYNKIPAKLQMSSDGFSESTSGGYYEFTIDGSTYNEFFFSQEQYIIIYCNPNNHNDCTNKNPATLKKSYIKYAWISGLIPVITIPAVLIVNKLKKHK